jgi:iron complex outermembrane recepter protein
MRMAAWGTGGTAKTRHVQRSTLVTLLMISTALATVVPPRAALARPAEAPVRSGSADGAQRTYAIPAGPLAEALNRFADVSQLQLIYSGVATRNLRSGGLTGSHSARQALSRLLAGSGLTYRFTSANSVTIAASDAAGVTGAVPSGAVALDTIEVVGERSGLPPSYAGGQVARGARLGLLGNRDIMDTPFSIVSYTEKTIRDQQATSVAEVLTTTDPSVRASIGSTNRYDALTIRGFRVDNDEIALNGLYGLVPSYRINPDPIERIELLKGPGAFLNGMPPWGSVGGGVNVVTKRAGDEPLTRATTEYLSNSRFGQHFDIARRFGDEQQFGVRVNGALRGGDPNIDGQSIRNGSGSIGLDYRGERLRVSADIIYQNDWMRAAARGYTLLPGIGVPAAPDPRINLAQSFDRANAQSLTGLTRLEYDVTQNITVFGAIGGNHFEFTKQEAPGATILNAAGDASSTSTLQNGRTQSVSGEAGVRLRFNTGPVSHEMVLSGSSLQQINWLAQTRYPSYLTNIYFPTRLTDPGPVLSSYPMGKTSTSTLSSVAFADTLSVYDGLIQLTLGARRQQVQSANYASVTGAKLDSYDQSATTPAVALVIRPTKEISLYANYVEALTPASAPPAASANPNQVFAPFRSRQQEVGVKFDFGRLGLTLAAFQIQVPSGLIDPVTKIFSYSGEQRNRGIEVNAFGELAEGLRILGGVTFLDARLTRTQDGLYDGNYAVGAPRLQANLGLEWDTPFLQGLTLSGRVIYTDRAYVSADNTQSVPAWTRFDVGARYATRIADKPVVFRAAVTNLFDSHYWEANPTGYLISGGPRTFWLSTSFDF